MSPELSFTFSLLAVSLGLFFAIYLVYGKSKQKPLVGNYKPGSPDHAAFLKLIGNRKLLPITIVIILCFLVSLVFDILKILSSASSYSIFIVGPVAVGITLFVSLKVLPNILSEK